MKRMWIWATVVAGVLATGCTKEPIDNLTEEESRIYITNYDTSANFNNYSTYSIADSVAVISNERLASKELTSFDAQLIAATANALEQRGYVRVSKNATPDLGVTISRITSTSTGVVAYTDYYGYYGGYWDPYFWGYPGYSYYYPTYYGTYQVRENAVTVDVFDLKTGQQSNQLKSVWTGLLRGGDIYRTSSIADRVQALFNQSPYLKAR